MAGTTLSSLTMSAFTRNPNSNKRSLFKNEFTIINSAGQRKREESSDKARQPSVFDVERAIGAGKFRDRNFRSKKESGGIVNIVKNTGLIGPEESELEKMLRLVGERLVNWTEG